MCGSDEKRIYRHGTAVTTANAICTGKNDPRTNKE